MANLALSCAAICLEREHMQRRSSLSAIEATSSEERTDPVPYKEPEKFKPVVRKKLVHEEENRETVGEGLFTSLVLAHPA